MGAFFFVVIVDIRGFHDKTKFRGSFVMFHDGEIIPGAKQNGKLTRGKDGIPQMEYGTHIFHGHGTDRVGTQQGGLLGAQSRRARRRC